MALTVAPIVTGGCNGSFLFRPPYVVRVLNYRLTT